jgi:Formyl transferase
VYFFIYPRAGCVLNHPKRRRKIAIFTADDSTWALPTWIATLPLLSQDHDVVGIYLFPDRLGSLKGQKTLRWYAQVFGLYNVLIMALYAIKTKLSLLPAPMANGWSETIGSWQQLARHYQLQLRHADTPNAAAVVEWTKANEIDVVFIMVGNILKAEIINAPRIGMINKHASLLPSCRGLFPSFWGRLTGVPIGITFHQVDVGIDTGRALVQVSYPPDRARGSMLRFYMDTFGIYPQLAVVALEKLIAQEYLPLPEYPSDYHSLPTRADYRAYRRRGFKIAKLSDLFYRSTWGRPLAPPRRSALAGSRAEVMPD